MDIIIIMTGKFASNVIRRNASKEGSDESAQKRNRTKALRVLMGTAVFKRASLQIGSFLA